VFGFFKFALWPPTANVSDTGEGWEAKLDVPMMFPGLDIGQEEVVEKLFRAVPAVGRMRIPRSDSILAVVL